MEVEIRNFLVVKHIDFFHESDMELWLYDNLHK